MSTRFGCQSMVDRLRRVLVRRPDDAFGAADPDRWHYAARPNLELARAEHDRLVAILSDAGAEVMLHETPLADHADALFVHDPTIVTDSGAIILRMGKELRRGEERAMAATLEGYEVPILATLSGDARAEGGDMLWLDRHTLAIGQGFRSNIEGLRQLRAALRPLGVETVPVQLPHGDGPEACLHLMSLISMIDHDLAVAFLPLLPVPFVELMDERGIELVHVPEAEFPTMGPNVLALAPRMCVALEGNPVTAERLEARGCTVHTYRGVELSLKAEGGPTCLTRPIWRG